MTIKQALGEAASRLSSAGIDTPSLDASLLMAETLRTDRSRLVLAWDEPLPESGWRFFDSLLCRRLSGEPVAYILGRRDFRGLDFAVIPAVLIPRPDTETLVEAALETAREIAGASGETIPVLDLCTGSGAVAIALKHEMPELEVYASDISREALACARGNAARLLPGNSITFIESDLFAAFGGPMENADPGRGPVPCVFSVIVSNPPYIPARILPSLSPEVRREPRLALDGGEDGLGLIGRIIAGSPRRLADNGALLLEADPRQMESISAMLESQGYNRVQRYNDLSQRPRVIRGFLRGRHG
ncbi:MAG: peptide chain release factor N(5)-glutamine methyltransferase [Spirochaetaceae bacterium]|jgi:release factor glutamine methyltransferase|nr:peptide chain release factor N(5)-glutamine methyltransferase [Spirochaetaceae bacterium]